MFRPRCAVALMAVLLLATGASATTLLFWDPLALTRHSVAVLQGRVFSVSTRWSQDGMHVLTDVELDVDQVWKGRAGKRVRVTQLGGEHDGIGQQVAGMAAFSAQEEVVVFLEAPTGQSFQLAGMAQGKYRVDRTHGVRAIPESLSGVQWVDEKTHEPLASAPARPALPLDELRAQVEAAAP